MWLARSRKPATRISKTIFLITVFFTFFTSCVTYYTRNIQFNNAFEKGDYKKAKDILSKVDESKNLVYRNRFLYYANLGAVLQRLGDYQASNTILEKAHIYLEDKSTDYTGEALGLLTTPSAVEYKPEWHETYMVNVLKTVNYLMMGQMQEALIEVRRLDIKLQRLEFAFKNENKFKKDAFVHLIMGLVYDETGDYNNAYIAYRNAYNIYQNEYQQWFNMVIPNQLVKDLIRVGDKTGGFNSEVNQFRKKYNIGSIPQKQANEQVLLQYLGLIPVKGEWSITFAVWRSQDRFVLENLEMNWRFYFPAPKEKEVADNFPKFIRMALPKLEDRPYWINTQAQVGSEKIEDLALVTHKLMKDNYEKIIGEALLRLFAKQAMSLSLSKKKTEGLGILVNLVNTFTETADTRSWSALPAQIYYKREIANEASKSKFKLIF
jgi:hypothetical protein